MIIICFTGKKGAGKSTCCDFLSQKYKIPQLAFATPLKQAVKSIFMLSDQDLNDPVLKEQVNRNFNVTPRQIMQKFGDVMRNFEVSDLKIKYNIFCDNMLTKLQNLIKNTAFVIISDCRLQIEMDCLNDFCAQNDSQIFYISIEKNLLQRGHNQNDTHDTEANIFSNSSKFKIIKNDSSIQNLCSNADSFFQDIRNALLLLKLN